MLKMALLPALLVLLLCASCSLGKTIDVKDAPAGKGVKRQVFTTDVLGNTALNTPSLPLGPAQTVAPVAPVQTSVSIEPNPVVLRQEVPRFITRTITQNVQVPISVPVAVPVDRQVPVRVPYPVDRPIAVPVVHRVQVPIYYERRVPYHVRVPVPYPVAVERPVPVDRPVVVERRVPYPVPQQVPAVTQPAPFQVPESLLSFPLFPFAEFGINGLTLNGR